MTTPEPVESATTAAAPARGAPRPWYRQPLVAIVAAAAVLLAMQWYDNHQQMNVLQLELSRRLAAADDENRGVAEQVREATREVQARLGALEARMLESQNQQSGLEARYQELSRSRDEALLADIEQSLLAANQQIQAAGNVRAALTSLQAVNARLARLDQPQFAALRAVVARDIERLKQAPQVDFAALAARIDAVAASLDSLPLVAEARPADAAAGRKPPTVPDANAWTRLAREFWQDLRDLVRIQKIDNADAVPLAPSQAYFLRENLRLRLLGARLALLAHNDKIYQADLKAAREWLARYFDLRKEAVAAAATTLRQLHESATGIEPPDVAASLDAVRNLRLTREHR